MSSLVGFQRFGRVDVLATNPVRTMALHSGATRPFNGQKWENPLFVLGLQAGRIKHRCGKPSPWAGYARFARADRNRGRARAPGFPLLRRDLYRAARRNLCRRDSRRQRILVRQRFICKSASMCHCPLCRQARPLLSPGCLSLACR
jgi:hypothetical protein